MKSFALAKSIYSILRLLTLLPHIVLFSTSSNRWIIKRDLERWSQLVTQTQKQASDYHLYKDFVRIMTINPEFRSVFYCRIEHEHPLLTYIMSRYLCVPQSTLYITTPASNIGPGLFILHGFSTIISAKSIGSNCFIGQQVTIGFRSNDPNDCPTIEDNVAIMTGAIVIGGITIGSNSTVGANAVVIKDVPKNCTVVGVPAYIVKRNGLPTKESL
jgi:serine O-acetyltransferase